ncbi:hypothetical protein [Longimicrobium sp.]|uniref:hypothetical protein n=1 Tax=Longimicrobium sp. TaxID=2029185 RepID=UPI002E327B1B|nr:hypothetical protein [Longimicrobium sp.]HEX6038612.1 hypothetical protein [Longimicrobium sp.]
MEDQEHPRDDAGADGLACAWIENEGLLRDEGVVFGLMRNAAALKEKEAAIRAFHRRRMAEEARRRAAVLAELDALLHADAPQADGVHAENGGSVVPIRPPLPAAGAGHGAEVEEDAPGGLVARYALGLAAAAVACAGTAVFVYEQMRPHFQQPALVTAGIVAAGCFTASLPVSLLFTGDDARRASGVEPWKVRLAELGLPFVAALFVVAWSWDALGALRALATGALLLGAFAFAGRQALSTLPRLGSAVRALRRERAQHHAEAAERERRAADDGVAALRRRLAGFRSEEEWDAVCETRLAIFRSEYELAAARAAQPAPARLAPTPLFAANESH